MDQPFENVRVIDVATVIAGPGTAAGYGELGLDPAELERLRCDRVV